MNIHELREMAMVLYSLEHADEDAVADAEAAGLHLDWTKTFTKDELVALWDDICKNLNYPYDDEVFEALYSLNHFAEEHA